LIPPFEFKATAPGVRLDAALLAAAPESTRALVRDAIAAGDVLVDSRRASKGMKLRGGELISVKRLAGRDDNIVAPDPLVVPRLVHEDAAFLAFDKPAGIPVHPLSRTEKGTLMNGVVARWPECAPLGDRPLMAGAIHRIDSGTSGLVLVARSAGDFERLRAQFSAQTVEKTYLALVEGDVAAGATLENDLVHDPTVPFCRMVDAAKNRIPMADRERLRPLHATTSFRPVAHIMEENEARTLLEVVIFTGVTHQIRAQLAMAGMHVVNDRLYGAFAVEGQIGHCLHALAARFRHPRTGEETVVRTAPPRWAAALLA